jgi:hypothetical protein
MYMKHLAGGIITQIYGQAVFESTPHRMEFFVPHDAPPSKANVEDVTTFRPAWTLLFALLFAGALRPAGQERLS